MQIDSAATILHQAGGAFHQEVEGAGTRYFIAFSLWIKEGDFHGGQLPLTGLFWDQHEAPSAFAGDPLATQDFFALLLGGKDLDSGEFGELGR
jgi:hypothetical protein